MSPSVCSVLVSLFLSTFRCVCIKAHAVSRSTFHFFSPHSQIYLHIHPYFPLTFLIKEVCLGPLNLCTSVLELTFFFLLRQCSYQGQGLLCLQFLQLFLYGAPRRMPSLWYSLCLSCFHSSFLLHAHLSPTHGLLNWWPSTWSLVSDRFPMDVPLPQNATQVPHSACPNQNPLAFSLDCSCVFYFQLVLLWFVLSP